MAKLCMAHASTHSARKLPGPKEERGLNDGDNNGQATHGARKHAWRTQATWSKRKKEREKERLNKGDNNGQATHGARKHAWRTQAAWAKNYVLTMVSNGWREQASGLKM